MRVHGWQAALLAIAAALGQAYAQQPGSEQPSPTLQPSPQPPAAQQPAMQPPSAQPPTTAQPPAATQQPITGAPQGAADACVELLNGRVPAGQNAAALRAECEGMLRRGAAPAQPSVTAGVATAAPAPGATAPTSLTQTPQELAAPGGVGTTRRGPVQNTLFTDPLGWFSGLGVNASYTRPFRWDRASWIAGARYSRTNATNGHVTSFGLGTGADLFLYGRNNEGIRLGPRLDFSFGREEFDTSTDFARLGVSAELGYNYIAASGISAAVMGGYGARLAGDEQDENFTSYTGGEDGPYLRLGVGYSW